MTLYGLYMKLCAMWVGESRWESELTSSVLIWAWLIASCMRDSSILQLLRSSSYSAVAASSLIRTFPASSSKMMLERCCCRTCSVMISLAWRLFRGQDSSAQFSIKGRDAILGLSFIFCLLYKVSL